MELKKRDIVENVKQEKKETKLVLQQTIKPHEGHTLFEYNLETKEINKATFEKQDISFDRAANGDYSKKGKVISKEGCLYISALNKKNVIKILIRDYGINPHS